MTSIRNNEKTKNIKINRRFLLSGLIFLVCIAGYYGYSRSQTKASPQVSSNKMRTIGLENAPVTIVEYADFNCPTCKAWQLHGIKEQILMDYPDQVRFVWRDFPIITADSPKAAEAGWCANDQGEFWKYHDLLYFMAPELDVQKLKEYADQAGLDMPIFSQCLDSGQHQSDVQKDLQDAKNHGFFGTPAFLVNGKPLIGPPSYSQLVNLIEAELPKGN